MAIKSALDAKEKWAEMRWEERAAIFLKAAELVAGPTEIELTRQLC